MASGVGGGMAMGGMFGSPGGMQAKPATAAAGGGAFGNLAWS